jgi:DUF1009 family protein
MRRALKKGDDGALRIVMALFEENGFAVLGAHEVAPQLVLAPSVVGTLVADATAMAVLGDQISADQGNADLGQACVIRAGDILAREANDGTDAMLSRLPPSNSRTGILYKAPKPGQDRRIDLPTIGPDTVRNASIAGLAGIVIEANGVLVLDQPGVLKELKQTGLFLWSRERQI